MLPLIVRKLRRNCKLVAGFLISATPWLSLHLIISLLTPIFCSAVPTLTFATFATYRFSEDGGLSLPSPPPGTYRFSEGGGPPSPAPGTYRFSEDGGLSPGMVGHGVTHGGPGAGQGHERHRRRRRGRTASCRPPAPVRQETYCCHTFEEDPTGQNGTGAGDVAVLLAVVLRHLSESDKLLSLSEEDRTGQHRDAIRHPSVSDTGHCLIDTSEENRTEQHRDTSQNTEHWKCSVSAISVGPFLF